MIKFIILFSIFLVQCENTQDKIWDDYFSSVGGHHEYNLTDFLQDSGFCSDAANSEDCYEGFMFYYILIGYKNQTSIQIKNSSTYSRITFTFKDQVVILAASEISKIITVPFDPTGLYKIETSLGVVFENSSFNFRGSLKDGTIITTDGTLINDLDLGGCNLINVETGKIETVSGQCLTPTNP